MDKYIKRRSLRATDLTERAAARIRYAKDKDGEDEEDEDGSGDTGDGSDSEPAAKRGPAAGCCAAGQKKSGVPFHSPGRVKPAFKPRASSAKPTAKPTAKPKPAATAKPKPAPKPAAKPAPKSPAAKMMAVDTQENVDMEVSAAQLLLAVCGFLFAPSSMHHPSHACNQADATCRVRTSSRC